MSAVKNMKEVIKDISQLKEPAKPLEFLTEKGIEKEEGESIIKALKEALDADKSIIALSAPQIGINKRIFCIRFAETIKTFINPIVTKKADYKIAVETCASMPGKEIVVARPEDITVIYYNDTFKYEDNKLLGAAARIFDQQTNFLDGVTPDELGLVSDINEDGPLGTLTDEEFQEVVKIYKQLIEVKSKALQEAIKADEEASKQYKHLQFAEKVIHDEVQVVDNTPTQKLNRAQRRALDKQTKQLATKLKLQKGKK